MHKSTSKLLNCWLPARNACLCLDVFTVIQFKGRRISCGRGFENMGGVYSNLLSVYCCLGVMQEWEQNTEVETLIFPLFFSLNGNLGVSQGVSRIGTVG